MIAAIDQQRDVRIHALNRGVDPLYSAPDHLERVKPKNQLTAQSDGQRGGDCENALVKWSHRLHSDRGGHAETISSIPASA